MGFAGPLDVVITACLAIRRFGLRRTLWASMLLSPLWLWSLPPVPCTSMRPLFRRCAVSRPYQSWVKADLKNLASQQEIHRVERGRYSDNLRALGFDSSHGISVEIYATPRAGPHERSTRSSRTSGRAPSS